MHGWINAISPTVKAVRRKFAFKTLIATFKDRNTHLMPLHENR